MTIIDLIWSVCWRVFVYGAIGLAIVRLLWLPGPNVVGFIVSALISIGSFFWLGYVLVTQTRRYRRFRAGPPVRQ